MDDQPVPCMVLPSVAVQFAQKFMAIRRPGILPLGLSLPFSALDAPVEGP
jgi:hypothetical protein